MKYQRKGLQFSFVIHATLLLVVLFLGGSLGRFSKPVVIDFSIEDSVLKGRHRSSPESRSREVKAQQPEQPMPQPEPVKQEQVIPQEEAPKQTVATSETAPQSQAPVAASRPAQSVQPVAGNSATATSTAMTEAKAPPSNVQGNFSEGMKQSYLKEHFAYIRNIVQRKLNYPKVARQMGWEGRVIISFVVCLDGRAKDIIIKQGSGFELLDKNAVVAVQSASPFPKPPVEAQLVIPISYSLN